MMWHPKSSLIGLCLVIIAINGAIVLVYSGPLIPFLSILACRFLVPDRGVSSDVSRTFEEVGY
jgi:hypothetical protein